MADRAAYDRLWSEIRECDACTHALRIDPEIRAHWQAKETPFLPYPGLGPEPTGPPMRYLLVGMEPSLKPKRKKTREYMLQKIAEGQRNFNDPHIRWAARTWLVRNGKDGAFVMTDHAKCMLPTKTAQKTAPRRYANCAPWLGREVALLPSLRAIIPLGDTAHTWCLALAQESWPTITKPIVHPAYRFVRWKRGQARYTGMPSADEFAEYAKRCDPDAKPYRLRLDTRRRAALLARWQVQFAEIRSELDRMDGLTQRSPGVI